MRIWLVVAFIGFQSSLYSCVPLKDREESFLAKPIKKKRSRSQLKEQLVETLEKIGYEVSFILTAASELLTRSKIKSELPSLTALHQLHHLLKTGDSSVKNRVAQSKESIPHYVSSLLHVVSDIQMQLIQRVHESVEDSGDGVFSSLPYAQFNELCEKLELQLIEIKSLSSQLRNASRLIN